MKLNRASFKISALILILAAVVYGSYLLVQGADITITMPSLFRPAPGSRLIMSMEGFRFTQSESGRVTWLMNAKSADLYDNKEARLKEIEINFKNPGKKEAVLRGETGTMDTTSGNASIRRGVRDVRIITSDGYLLTTDSLVWKAGERTLTTADPFKLLGSEVYLEGVGLVANMDVSTIVVKENVKAVLQE